ncbi:M20 family metallo-hydrolase [Siminovitchia sp. 179-K 8D1 HS]|uniref:M20 family metallo-hydrolase n=1 Tax=Siminovitchia sp. 179-K 8D1 HS TaxID=3142385 RepID=UPI0039A1AF4E
MKINKERLWDRIQMLGEIGQSTNGGITRLAFSKEDRKATDLVIGWMREAGLEVWTDPVGNVFGRREGTVKGPVVLTGSHLDTVRNGGKFDGAAGVLSALEVIQTLNDYNIETILPIEIVIFVNEEGSRYAGGLMGSMAIAGLLPESILDEKDNEGIPLSTALKEFGGMPNQIHAAKRPGSDFAAFYELHIEQSQTLEKEDKSAGIVLGIAGPYQMKVIIYGRSGHAGAVAMNLRNDPMVAAGIIIQEVEKVAKETAPTTRGTVGYVKAFPGGHNVIPEKVELTIDIRDINEETRERVVSRIQKTITKICDERGLKSETIVTQNTPPVPVNKETIEKMKQIANEEKIPFTTVTSGAAHDAMIMGKLCPIGMVFIRSINGLSHCPEEFSTREDLADGTQILLHLIKDTANPPIIE